MKRPWAFSVHGIRGDAPVFLLEISGGYPLFKKMWSTVTGIPAVTKEASRGKADMLLFISELDLDSHIAKLWEAQDRPSVQVGNLAVVLLGSHGIMKCVPVKLCVLRTPRIDGYLEHANTNILTGARVKTVTFGHLAICTIFAYNLLGKAIYFPPRLCKLCPPRRGPRDDWLNIEKLQKHLAIIFKWFGEMSPFSAAYIRRHCSCFILTFYSPHLPSFSTHFSCIISSSSSSISHIPRCPSFHSFLSPLSSLPSSLPLTSEQTKWFFQPTTPPPVRPRAPCARLPLSILPSVAPVISSPTPIFPVPFPPRTLPPRPPRLRPPSPHLASATASPYGGTIDKLPSQALSVVVVIDDSTSSSLPTTTAIVSNKILTPCHGVYSHRQTLLG